MPYIFQNETSEIVHVKKSKIPGAGQGLFAKQDIAKGEFVAWYTGVFVPKEMVENDYYSSDYLLTLRGQDLVIDAADPLSCLGRYINDPLSKRGGPNCKFMQYQNVQSGGVHATKDIKKGGELYISYGHEFWLLEARFNKLSAANKAFVQRG